jgi:hypothetical protein
LQKVVVRQLTFNQGCFGSANGGEVFARGRHVLLAQIPQGHQNALVAEVQEYRECRKQYPENTVAYFPFNELPNAEAKKQDGYADA